MIKAIQAPVAGAVLLLMVMRDMGNGVVRLESSCVLDASDLPSEVLLAGAAPVLLPLSRDMQDCVDVSLMLNGYAAASFRGGAARCVCDAITEVWLW